MNIKAPHVIDAVSAVLSRFTNNPTKLARELMDIAWEQSRQHITKSFSWKNTIAYRSPRCQSMLDLYPSAKLLWDGSRADDWLECFLESSEGYHHVMSDGIDLWCIDMADRSDLMQYTEIIRQEHGDFHYLCNILRQTLCVPV